MVRFTHSHAPPRVAKRERRPAPRLSSQAVRRPFDDEILLGDNLPLLAELADESFQLVYIDPPFNTGKTQSRLRLQMLPDDVGDRTGFGGGRHRTELPEGSPYRDHF